jgi:hypothetical protein
MGIYFLYLIAPLIVIFYKYFEYKGIWDKKSGRKYALVGLERLKNTHGNPVSWIYENKKED